MDAIVTVIDAENFIGYEDTSPTARMQASYTDMILIVSHGDTISQNSVFIFDCSRRINGNLSRIANSTLFLTTCTL
jgi:G3E family GTPase